MEAVNINRIRQPRLPQPGDLEWPALQFMKERGITSYEHQLQILADMFVETVSDAGPGGVDCPITNGVLDRIQHDINETARAAYDRYDDWRTDMLD